MGFLRTIFESFCQSRIKFNFRESLAAKKQYISYLTTHM